MAMAHTIAMPPTGIQCAALSSRRPMAAVTTKPASGRTTSSGIRASIVTGYCLARRGAVPCCGERTVSPGHRVVLVDERGPLVAVDGDHDGQANGRFGGGHGHDHERDDRPLGGDAL